MSVSAENPKRAVARRSQRGPHNCAATLHASLLMLRGRAHAADYCVPCNQPRLERTRRNRLIADLDSADQATFFAKCLLSHSSYGTVHAWRVRDKGIQLWNRCTMPPSGGSV